MLFANTSHANFDFDVQYLLNVAFSFEKVRMVEINPPQVTTNR